MKKISGFKNIGQPEQALASLAEAVRRKPDCPEAHLQLGDAQEEMGRLEEAVASYRKALELRPEWTETTVGLGRALLKQRHFDEAATCFREALTRRPNWAEVHHNLGVALARRGQLTEAVASFQEALRLRPDVADAHESLALAHLQSGRPAEAAACYRKVTELRPESAEVWHRLGNTLRDAGQAAEALPAYQEALRLRPEYVEAWHSQGLALAALNRAAEASDSYRQALQLRPAFVEAHNNLGLVLKDLGKLDEAVAHFRKATGLRPGMCEAHNNLGITLAARGKLDEAVASYQEALRLNPKSVETHNNLANTLRRQGKLSAAAAHLHQALQLKPDSAQAHNNLAIVLGHQGKLDEAVASYERALQIRPEYAEAHNNLGVALADLHRLEEALACYDRALALQPDYADAHLNRALAWLLRGDFARGWPEYEWRLRMKDRPPRAFAQPRWNGASLGGRTILLHGEQGMGDTIQFVRYAALLKAQGATVVLEAPRSLARLLHNCPGVDQLVEQGQPLPAFDVHAPLLSLPGLLGTTLETIPATTPYLSADPVRRSYWRERLQALRGLKVGVVWQGNPKYAGDHNRSVRLEQLAPLAAVPGVSLVSLQKGPGSEQLAKLDGRVLDLGSADWPDFAETAALVAELDLVVAVDTGVAHLAGALGVPVWVALPFANDWRWLLDREDSPWYPSMRLLRQPRRGDWDDVVRRMAGALAEKVNAPPAPLAIPAPALSEPGLALLQRGDLSGAMDHFREAVQRSPEAPELHYHLGLALARLRKLEEAIRCFRRVIELNPSSAEAHSNLGLAYLQQGKLDEAKRVLQEALRLKPDLAPTHNNLGIVLGRQGKLADAIACYRRAVELRPDYVDAHNNLGNALRTQGKSEEAVVCLREALRLKPDLAEAHHNLGIALLALDRRDEAIVSYQEAVRLQPKVQDLQHRLANLLRDADRREESLPYYHAAVALDPNHAEVHHSLGLALAGLGRPAEAAASYQRSLELRPNSPEVHNNLGLVLKELGKKDEAVASLRRAVELKPTSAEMHNNLASALAGADRPEEAAACYEKAIRIKPNYTGALNNLANVLGGMGKFDEAVARYEEALQIDPKFFEGHNNLANALSGQGKMAEAIAHYEAALRLKPDYAEAHNNLANLLGGEGKLDEAVARYEEALRLKPDFADAHLNRAFAWLRMGQFTRGWPEYEWRFRLKNRSGRNYPQPRWDGSPLVGRTIFLHPEQGLGDTLQFVRYAPLLKTYGATVVLEAPKPLVRLFHSCPGIDHIIEQGAAPPAFDVHSSLLSLPGLLGTNLETIPAPVPYLTPDLERRRYWRERLAGLPGLKVGIVWQGNPKYAGDRNRSVRLEQFAPLAAVPGVTLVSLQKEPGSEQLAELGGRFAVAEMDSATWPDFAETAALVMELDLVVAVDTGVAHLAGALGMPVWVAVPFANDWRWLREREDTPWYPTMRLFRQRRRADWDEVFARLATALAERVQAAQAAASVSITDADAAHSRGVALVKEKKLDEAVVCFRQALRSRPRSTLILNNLGVALAKQGRLDEAVGCFREVVRLEPGSASGHGNLGLAYLQQNRSDEAVMSLRQALRLDPKAHETHNNLGVALMQLHRPEDALPCYERALQLRPDYAEAHENQARAWLLQGEFARGWPEYEWRFQARGKRQLPQPRWDGSPLAGRTIFLHPEQGLGDTIQFVRYAALVQQRGGRVLLETPKPLARLLRTCSGVDQFIDEGETPPPYEVHASLLSLPGLLGTTAEANPAAIPYLSAEPPRRAHWRSRLAQLPGFKVGIVWQGNPKYSADRQRSVRLEQFAPLAAVPGVTLVSLQKGPGSEQLAGLSERFAVVDLGSADWPDFAETAALVSELDLVVAVDTAVAHLAGALGVPVWVALPFANDWRWLREREDTPWYPTMRLVRQRHRGNWDEVFDRLAAALAGTLQVPLPPSAVAVLSSAEPAKSSHEQGIALVKEGRLDEAIAALLRAREEEPDSAEVRHNLGVALAKRSRLEEAVASFEASLRLRPESADAYENLALAQLQRGRRNEAATAYRKLTELRPESAEAWHRLANVLRDAGRMAEALPCYQEALRLRPDHADALHSFGLALASQGRLDEAANVYRRALEIKPDFGDVHNNLGILLEGQGKYEEAVACFRKALEIRPNASEVLSNLGIALSGLERLDEAEESYRHAVRLKPTSSAAHNNLGNLLRKQGRLAESEASLREALRLKPDYAEAHNNLGIVLIQQGRLDDGIACYDRALELKADYADAHLNRALAWLLLGHYDRGWPEYEWRWKMKDRRLRSGPQPCWDGAALQGRTVLLYAEQGQGDTLQFVRYAALIQQRGGRVVLEAPKSLARLLGSCPGVAQLVEQGQPLPPFDVHAPLMSLPGLLGTTTPGDIPAPVPYLSALPERRAHWRSRLAQLPGFKVGIVWQGNPKYAGDRQRSVRLEQFAPLANVPGVTLVNLQKGLGSEQLAALGGQFTVAELGSAEWPDFAETAALVSELDLVVAVDTAVAHLAGALGVPTWVALPFANDWRWLLDREDSPWYPTVRLFRQSQRSDWGTVFRRMADALDALVKTAPARPVAAASRIDADRLHQQGIARFREGRLPEAVHHFRRALAVRPDAADVHHNLAVALAKQGKLDEAVASFREALRLHPDSGEVLGNLGLAHVQRGDWDEAVRVLREAVRLRPNSAPAHSNLGIALAQHGEVEEAVACYRRAIEVQPDYADAYNNLGNALRKLDRFDEAAAALRQALQLRPDLSEAHNNLGIVTAQLGDLEAAAHHYQEALRLKPDHLEAHNNLGTTLADLGRLEEALAWYEKALRLDPDSALVRMNRSLTWLRMGNFIQGWPEYEARWRGKDKTPRSFRQPRWDGGLLNGRTILLYAEQGLGDTLQFVRYAALVQGRGGKVVLEAPRLLTRLLRTCPGVDHLVEQGQALPSFDVQAPLMSLPGLLGTTVGTIPAPVPYLSADPERRAYWKERLAALPGLKVGIVWQGNPKYAGDRNRSVSLEQFAPLTAVSGVTLVSLQKGPGSEQLADLDSRVVDLGSADWPDFAETAALVAELDLVVAVDTAVAHLAGALGVPVWVALPFASDWRWLRDRLDTPWYPTMRLFQQRKRGDWSSVFADIADALAALVQAPPERITLEDARALHEQGVALFKEGKLDSAVASFRKALLARPQAADWLHNLGVAHAKRGALDEAIACFRQALHIRPDSGDALGNLGLAHLEQGRSEEAVAAFRRSLALQPDHAENHSNLGVALMQVAEVEQALAEYNEALRFNPEHTGAHFNRAMALLALGNFEEGWREYDWRWRTKQLEVRSFPQPAWDGSPLEGRTLLLHSEQGLGDTFQFIRYAPQIKEHGGRVLLECPRSLLRVLARCPGIDGLIGRGDLLPAFDVHAPLMSLPALFRTTLAHVPAPVPYLYPDPSLQEHWRRRLQVMTGFKIGIVWKGNRNHDKTGHRDIPLTELAPLARLPGVRLISLQKGPGVEQLAALGKQFAVTDLGPELDQAAGPFMDTAAIMANLDLVISSDTSIPHLAGALGVPTWVALPLGAEWRWLRGREDSPWYPTLRLFRQQRRGDWADVVRRMADVLAERLRAAPAHDHHARELHQRGLRLLKEGKLDDAASCLREGTERWPERPELHHTLGVALAKRGQLDAALVSFRRVLHLGSRTAETLGNLGLAYLQRGKWPKTVAALRQALRLQPDGAATHNNLGIALANQGKLAEAVACYRRAIELQPGYADAHNNLGNSLRRLGNYDEALTVLRQALELQPKSVQVQCNLGLAYLEQEKYEEATAILRQALELNPDSKDAHNNLGAALAHQNKFEEAIACYRRALELEPNCPDVYKNLGNAFRLQGNLEEAVTTLRHSLRLKPDSPETLNSLGIALARQGQLEEAIACYEQVLQIKPDAADALTNLGAVLADQGKLDEALDCYARALQLPGDPAVAHMNRALAWLRKGDFVNGLPEYEWRWRGKGRSPRALPQPRWDGSPLEGRTILLHPEQGQGDVLQFVRYAALVKARGATVVLEASKPLARLLRTCPGVDQLVEQGQPLPAFDVHAPLLSLPGLLGTRVDSIPATLPYLSTDPARRAYWKERLAALPGLRVGIVWQGNPKYAGDHNRSVRLEQFAPLAAVPGVSLVSLQKGPGSEQLEGLDGRFTVAEMGSADWADFAETAALVSELDLVIAVDTAVAHLAGALGMPTWVALPCASDWRWLRDREDTPWYPSMRLFRQTQRGDWGEVFARIAAALAEHVGTIVPQGPVDIEEAQQRGVALVKQGKLAEAVACFRQVLEARPGTADLHHNLGVALAKQGHLTPAIASFREALRLRPDSAEVLGNLGLAHVQRGAWDEAVTALRQAAQLRPDAAQVHSNLGIALAHRGEVEEAVACYRRAVAAQPNYADGYNNLGNALRQLGQVDEAIAALHHALHLRPDLAEAHNNLGVALEELDRLDEAVACYEQAMRLQPGHVEAHFNRALAWLRRGDFARGWPEYEWRLRMKDRSPRTFSRPRWDGSPLNGRTILLCSEQGLGDTLQFARFAAPLKARGATVLLEAPRPLARLLRTCPGIDQLVEQGQALPAFDVHAPLMTLPGLLGTDLANIPASFPYLSADPARRAFWKERLAGLPGRKVGIVWQGNPKHLGDRQRSVRLEQFAALAAVPGVTLVSLQKGPGSEQLAGLTGRFTVVELGSAEWSDFAETAALVSELDLVVAVDTAVAHLAGALGVPTWVVLPFASDWRWLRGRDDSPWYPGMRLVRQRQRSNWNEVFARVAVALAEQVSVSPASETSAEQLQQRGLALIRGGKLDEAIGCLRRALEIRPGTSAVHLNLGVALAKRGRLDEAIVSFREVLRLKPTADAWENLGLACLNRGSLPDAVQAFQAALELVPASASAHNNLGIALSRLGRAEEAVTSYRRAVEARPSFADAHNNLGNALRSLGRLEEATSALREALRLKPDLAPALSNLGALLVELGQDDEAVSCYQKNAELQPASPEAHSRLGNLLRKRGKLTEAATCYRRVTDLQPNHADAMLHRAEVLAALGQTTEAIQGYQQFLRLKPECAEVHNNLGVIYRDQGDLEAAIACYREALRLKPETSEVHSNLGIALAALGKLDEALLSHRQAVRMKPDSAIAHNNLGNVLRKQSKWDEALVCFQTALQLDPGYAGACNNLALVFSDQKKWDEATAHLRRALEIDPNFAEAHNNLGTILADQGKHEEAVACYEEALRRKPDYVDAYNNLGNALWKQGRLGEAITNLKEALRRKPTYADAHNNLGIVLVQQGRIEEGLACYDRALEHKAEHADAHFNRSLAWLLQGDYVRGWPEYEWRWKMKDRSPRPFAQPRWDGCPLHGRTILLYAEQGLGDTMQFVRYAATIKSQGATVVLEAQKPLARLLRTCPGVDQVVEQGQPLPAFDVHAPLLSLPRLLGTDLATVPASIPYLAADPERRAFWRERLTVLPGRKVGIAWQGNPKYPGDRQRSARLEQFAPLAAVPGVTLVSLQKGPGSEQLAAPGDRFAVAELGSADWPDFAETAALVSELDLVVAVDTAVAHLAGALGVPTWVALPFANDWRWLREREDTPWYPGMRLVRQRQRGEWGDVFRRIGDELSSRSQ